jgi:PAS domain S-box-containing protein
LATRFLAGANARFDSLRGMAMLFAGGTLLGPFLSSFLDAAFVSFNKFGNQSYWQVWKMRFCSNVFTALTLAPVIVLWSTTPFTRWQPPSIRRLLEIAVVFSGLLATSFLIFWGQEVGPAAIAALLYAPLPFLVWAAVRFGPAGTSTAILLVAMLAISGAVNGRGPFAFEAPEQNALSIQAFFASVAIALMFLSISIAERARAEERFTKAFHANPDAVFICRRQDGYLIAANERCQSTFGQPGRPVIGQTIFDLDMYASADDRERFLAAISDHRPLRDFEMRLRTRSGDVRHKSISAETDKIGGEQSLIITIRDITDRKQAEEAHQNLAHASRLAVVGELTAMIGHEVNQPLGAILSNAEAAEILLKLKEPPLQEIREILADIRKNDLRADQAVRRIRALLGKRETQMQPLDLNETAADVVRLVSGDALRRRVHVRKEFAADLPMVTGDRVQLQQVLLNLIVNAMDAMILTPESERQVTLETKRGTAGKIQVSVKDSGKGVPADKLNRIFDSFFTTKKEGMGLGLSIARSIVDAHHGRIWVENNPEGGATFHFTLKPSQIESGQA